MEEISLFGSKVWEEGGFAELQHSSNIISITEKMTLMFLNS